MLNEITSSRIIKDINILYINIEKENNNSKLSLLKENFNNFDIKNDLVVDNSIYENLNYDVIIINFNKNKHEVFDFVKEVKDLNNYQQVIFIAEDCSKEDLFIAINHNINAFLINPTKEEFISKVFEHALKYNSTKNKIKKRIILQNILDNQSGLVMLTDFNSIHYSSKSFLDFFNIEKQSDLFKIYDNLWDIFIKHDNYLHANSKEEFIKKFKEARALKKVVLIIGKDYTPKAFHIHIDRVKNIEEELYIVSLSNISIMQETNIKITQKAYIDGLTEVYNRNKFEEVFTYEYEQFKRYQTDLCIAILDIDHFKKFNDTYGHLIGDEVLINIAQVLNKNIRATDLFARWWGEEFVLLMPKTSLEEAKVLCEKLRIIVENQNHKKAGKVTCSFGITNLQKEDNNLKSIFSRCDIALYNAKMNGRNKIETL